MDMRSILEAIEQKREFDKLEEKYTHKLEKDANKLEHLNQGRKSFVQKLTKKPIEHCIIKRELRISNLTEEVKNISKISKVIVSRLILKEIPRFKEYKMAQHEYFIKNFAKTSILEFQSLIDQGKDIGNCLNCFSN